MQLKKQEFLKALKENPIKTEKITLSIHDEILIGKAIDKQKKSIYGFQIPIKKNQLKLSFSVKCQAIHDSLESIEEEEIEVILFENIPFMTFLTPSSEFRFRINFQQFIEEKIKPGELFQGTLKDKTDIKKFLTRFKNEEVLNLKTTEKSLEIYIARENNTDTLWKSIPLKVENNFQHIQRDYVCSYFFKFLLLTSDPEPLISITQNNNLILFNRDKTKYLQIVPL